MDLEDEETWPVEVIHCLADYHDFFLNWELRNNNRGSPQEYDQAIYRLQDLLRTNFVLRGYHCTRLTNTEIQHILADGMQLPDQKFLYKRINSIEQDGFIKPQDSEHLKNKNEADESNRAGMISFCFYPPYKAGQGGIERLFRSWGGEALYNSHEDDPVLGPILNGIGTPCIIEAYVPIISLRSHGGLESKVVRRYLVNRGLKTVEPLDHEGRAEQPIPSQNISRIIPFPDSDFIRLTGCNTWEPQLT